MTTLLERVRLAMPLQGKPSAEGAIDPSSSAWVNPLLVYYGYRRPLFDPFVNFVEFVAIEIKIAPIGVCSQTSRHVTLMF